MFIYSLLFPHFPVLVPVANHRASLICPIALSGSTKFNMLKIHALSAIFHRSAFCLVLSDSRKRSRPALSVFRAVIHEATSIPALSAHHTNLAHWGLVIFCASQGVILLSTCAPRAHNTLHAHPISADLLQSCVEPADAVVVGFGDRGLGLVSGEMNFLLPGMSPVVSCHSDDCTATIVVSSLENKVAISSHDLTSISNFQLLSLLL